MALLSLKAFSSRLRPHKALERTRTDPDDLLGPTVSDNPSIDISLTLCSGLMWLSTAVYAANLFEDSMMSIGFLVAAVDRVVR